MIRLRAEARKHGMQASYDVLGVAVSASQPASVLAAIETASARGPKTHVCFATVHGVMEALRDPAVLRAYNRGLTVPDGMPLVWLGRLRGHPEVARVYGPDMTLLLCEEAARKGWGCYFYGGAPGVAEVLGERLMARFPGLRVAGVESPPFRRLTDEEDAAAVARINASRADLVFVGLGCPKQELWMAAHGDRLEAPVLLGVGAAFDFHTGRIAQAPRWMMRVGLEWLFRLSQEPRRLWHRYLVLNALFVVHATLQLLGRRYPKGEEAAGSG